MWIKKYLHLFEILSFLSTVKFLMTMNFLVQIPHKYINISLDRFPKKKIPNFKCENFTAHVFLPFHSCCTCFHCLQFTLIILFIWFCFEKSLYVRKKQKNFHGHAQTLPKFQENRFNSYHAGHFSFIPHNVWCSKVAFRNFPEIFSKII